jgi:hypothetical protein
MEDISRELEREIALSKPKPFKQDRKTRVIIVDDFGHIKSGRHLKIFVTIFSVTTFVCLVAAGLFYFLYTGLSRESRDLKDRVVLAEKNMETLAREKEMLMARLVMSGQDLEKIAEAIGIKGMDQNESDQTETGHGKTDQSKAGQKDTGQKGIDLKQTVQNQTDQNQTDQNQTDPKGKDEQDGVATGREKSVLVQTDPDSGSLPPESEDSNQTPAKIDPVKPATAPGLNGIAETPALPSGTEPAAAMNKTVSIEKFTVVKDKKNSDLLVRFDIRNISTGPGDVSGRIFTVLKPDHNQEDLWLVVPAAPLKDGVPSEYSKGQYFSIAHFKPVKFRIRNMADPDFFTKASIFIFNEKAELIFEELIDITEAE